MAKKKIKNYGLIVSFPSEGDYVLGQRGSKLGRQVVQENGQWDAFLPVDELQSIPIETMACVSFGTLSACEILAKRLFGVEKNWSDRFLAWNSGTSTSGNSPHAVCEYLRKAGSPLQEKWDYTPDLDTWDEFYETPPAKMLDYAREDFLDLYSFGHEYVETNADAIKEALKYSPLGFAVHAWAKRGDAYYQPLGVGANHWVVCYGYVEQEGGVLWKLFDTYDETRKLYDGTPIIVKRFELKKRNARLDLTWSQLLCKWFGFCK